MAFALRNSLRSIPRAQTLVHSRIIPHSRQYTVSSAVETIVASSKEEALLKFQEQDAALQHHAAEASDLWRKISFYVCIPAIAVCVAWVYNAENEHAAHVEHIKEENGGELPEKPAYDYMNRRAKPFPWGPNSLFFNSHANKDMS